MSKVEIELSGLEKAREIDGATRQDSAGRYYRLKPDGDGNTRVYGYSSHFSGVYVCYTCGHLCECGEEGE
jgi:hypothetical protein